MMEVQQQHQSAGCGPLDFSRRGVAEASAFRLVKPKQLASLQVQQTHQETNNNNNNNESLQVEGTRLGSDSDGEYKRSFITLVY